MKWYKKLNFQEDSYGNITFMYIRAMNRFKEQKQKLEMTDILTGTKRKKYINWLITLFYRSV